MSEANLKKGVVETRLSVTKLNHLVTSALIKEGVPAVSLPPFGQWTTKGKGEFTPTICLLPFLRERAFDVCCWHRTDIFKMD